jgi:hypothetical protein
VRGDLLVPLKGYFSLKFISQNEPDKINLFDVADRFHKLIEEEVPRSVVVKLQAIYLVKQIRDSWRAGINPYVPRLFGGLGLVPENEFRRPESVYQRICKRIVNHPFDHRANLLHESYPPDSLGDAVGKYIANMRRNMLFAFERSTDLTLCEDVFTPTCWVPVTYFHMFRKKAAQPRLFYYLAAVRKYRKKLGKKFPGTSLNYSRSYREMYDLESRIRPIKAVHDAVATSYPTRVEADTARRRLEDLRDSCSVDRIKSFIRSLDDAPARSANDLIADQVISDLRNEIARLRAHAQEHEFPKDAEG